MPLARRGCRVEKGSAGALFGLTAAALGWTQTDEGWTVVRWRVRCLETRNAVQLPKRRSHSWSPHSGDCVAVARPGSCFIERRGIVDWPERAAPVTPTGEY